MAAVAPVVVAAPPPASTPVASAELTAAVPTAIGPPPLVSSLPTPEPSPSPGPPVSPAPAHATGWLSLAVGSPAATTWQGALEFGTAFPVAGHLRVGAAVIADSPSDLPEVGATATTSRLRAEAVFGLDAGANGRFPIELRFGVAAHLFAEGGELLGALWSPQAGARVGWTTPPMGRFVGVAWVGATAEVFRAIAARDGVEVPLEPVGGWAGLTLVVVP